MRYKVKGSALAKTSHGICIWWSSLKEKTPEIRAVPRTQGLRFPKSCCKSPAPKAFRETNWSDLMDWTIMRGSSESSAARRALNIPSPQSCLVRLTFFPRYQTEAQLFPVNEPQLFAFPSPDLPLPLKGGLNRPLENRRGHRCHKD